MDQLKLETNEVSVAGKGDVVIVKREDLEVDENDA
jgi:hypothetical protein